MGFGPLAAAALQVGGSLFGKSKAARANARNLRRINALYNTMYGQASAYRGQAANLLQEAREQIDTGFGAAQASLDRVGSASRRRATDREVSNLGAMRQSMANRGMTNTTVQDSAARGIYSDTSRLMAEIDQGLASAHASLATQKAGAQATATSNLAGFLGGNQGPGMIDLLLSQAGMLSGVQHQQGSNWADALGAGVQTFGALTKLEQANKQLKIDAANAGLDPDE